MREEEEESDIEEDSYDEDDLWEEEEEYYEIPLKKILIIAASVIIVAGLGIGGYFMFFANPLTVTAQTIEAGTAIDDEYLLGLVSLKSNAEGKYTVSVSQNNVDASKTGEYTVTYDLENTSSGKTTSKTVTFKVVDTTAPVITVADSITVPLGGTFNIADYATVTDNADGVISASSISVSGSVDTAKAGTYPITLTVSDAAGNSSSADIKAVVEDSGNPADFMKKILGTWYKQSKRICDCFYIRRSVSVGYRSISIRRVRNRNTQFFKREFRADKSYGDMVLPELLRRKWQHGL